MIMSLCFFIFLLAFFKHGCCGSDIWVGYSVMVEVPEEYNEGFAGRAFVMETKNESEPSFRVGVSVEAMEGKFSCSLEVFLGDVKVWDSGHYWKFHTKGKCEMELTKDGDLRLKGAKQRVGWRTGTSGQGVQRLQIQRTGNLVLLDAQNDTKWQSFNFPTDVMLWSQRLDVATRLTSFQPNSSFFFSFEIEENRVALFLNSATSRYSYWEFRPSMNRTITFVKLGSKGLDLFDFKYKKIAQIPSFPSFDFHPIRFVALKNETGNLGFYYYSPQKSKFEASFQALNTTCDLPVACKPYGICTFSNSCSCIRSDYCIEGVSSGGFCDEKGKETEMLELENVSTVLRGGDGDGSETMNVSREGCEGLCLRDCKCASALYLRNLSNGVEECYIYRLVLGVREVEKGDKDTEVRYMMKVVKGSDESNGEKGLKKWVFVVVGVIDGVIIVGVVGGVGFWMMKKRERG